MNTSPKILTLERRNGFGRWPKHSFKTLFIPKGVKTHVFMLNYGHHGSVHGVIQQILLSHEESRDVNW